MTDAMRVAQDPYDFWREALNGTPIGSDELPVQADRPQCGFYRMRRGIKSPWETVAIFYRDDRLVALVDGNEVPPTGVWHWCCLNPVTEAAFHYARENGGEWGDLDDTVLLLQNQDAVPERFKTSAPYERLKQQINLAIGGAQLYSKIADDTTALKAQSLRAKLLELSNTADKLRETEKRPHFRQAQLIDSVWMPSIKSAKDAAGTIRKALSNYETMKAAQAVAERRNEPLPTRVESGYGRAASIRDKTVIASVEDWGALFSFYANDQRARDAILKLAEKDVASGIAMPGLTTKTEKDVR